MRLCNRDPLHSCKQIAAGAARVGGFVGVDYGTSDVRFPTFLNDGNKIWTFGPLGGGQIGYNYQINKWVFGAEADAGAAGIRGSRTCGLTNNLLVAGLFTPNVYDCSTGENWLVTATARIGYAWERTLFYAKAGAAFTDESVFANCIFNPANPPPVCNYPAGVQSNGFNGGTSHAGWTIGYGTEFDLGRNWSAKAEYDYIDFGRKSFLANDGSLISDHPTTSQVKIGVNYRFSPGAVVAKY